MRITQAYISPSVSDFDFYGKLGLKPYYDKDQPCIFFGLYRTEDLLAVLRHNIEPIICWCGHDAATFEDWKLVYHYTHICCHPKIYDKLTSLGIRATLFPPNRLVEKVNPIALGNQVYAYCPFSAPGYHGINTLVNLNTKFGIQIGDGSIPHSEWNPAEAYSNIFIGLVLSDWCGGAQSIIEMGLHGIRVVTNVLQLPNCLPWKTTSDIEKHIRKESMNIGQVNRDLSQQVLNALDNNLNILETDNYNK